MMGFFLVFIMLGREVYCGLFKCRFVVIIVGSFNFIVCRLLLILWVIFVVLLLRFRFEVNVFWF